MQNKDQNDLLSWLGLADTPDWKAARALGPLLSITISLLFVLALFSALAITSQTLFGWPTSNSPTSLGAGTLIVALLGAPFLVWNTVIKQKTVDFQKESHITDRISKAVEQLGAEKTVKKDGKEETVPNIEVRIGGLLSLERIAQDSTRYDKGRDHVRVMEILCAYVRENAPAAKATKSPFPEGCKDADIDAKLLSPPYDWAFTQTSPRSDVQLALTILGRRSAEQIDIERRHVTGKETGHSLDLSHTNLRRADLEGLNFENACFFKAKMEGAFCNGANFSGTNLIEASLVPSAEKE
jgi:hypothetical protein